jgi:hypothetical protein
MFIFLMNVSPYVLVYTGIACGERVARRGYFIVHELEMSGLCSEMELYSSKFGRSGIWQGFVHTAAIWNRKAWNAVIKETAYSSAYEGSNFFC